MLTVRFKNIPIHSGERILDLGCGEGRHSLGAYCAFNKLQIIGLDLIHKDLITATNRLDENFKTPNNSNTCNFICANGATLPFGDKQFDHVICSEVLEHIENYQAILNEIDRVLRVGGTLSISVPRAWPERICWLLSEQYHKVPGGHIRIFNARALKNQIIKMHYRHFAYHWEHALHVPYWWLKCIFWGKSESFWPIYWYHKLLLWDLFKRPWITRGIEKLLNPLAGKSIVLYFQKMD